MTCSVSYSRFVPIFGLLLISLSLPAIAQQTDTTSADLKTPADSTEVQSPIDPPGDTPDHCPDPGDYAPISGTTAWNWLQGVVESFISNPHEASLREDIGADHLTLDQLHVLLDATDAETCRQIQNKVPVPLGISGQDRVLHAYFQAEDFYFAVTMAVPLDPNEAFLGVILHIYDENLNFITGYL